MSPFAIEVPDFGTIENPRESWALAEDGFVTAADALAHAAGVYDDCRIVDLRAHREDDSRVVWTVLDGVSR